MTDWLTSKRLFTRRELWYHTLMMPILFPAGNYLFLNERYFNDPVVFGWGTLLVFGLYVLSLVILTAAVKAVFRRYPNVRQASQRNVVALLVATTLTAGLAAFDVWTYSLFPVFERPFDWGTVRAILVLGLVFDVMLCFMLGIQFTYGRWKESQIEKEQLKRQVVQHQIDSLKQQINPHFLFNALNSISSLIADEPAQAEVFVDEMAKVYRYLLQSNQPQLATLAEEFQFARSYTRLLAIRYKQAIQVRITINPAYEQARLPVLTLQTMIDTIIHHNTLKPDKPLRIQIETTAEGWLAISHSRQPRTVWVDTRLPGLDNVVNRYRAANLESPVVDADNGFAESTVRLALAPMLPAAAHLPK